MPFDPTLPLTDSDIESAVLRGQFTALKELCDAFAAQAATLTAQVATQATEIEGLQSTLTTLITQGQLMSAIGGTAFNPSSVSNFTGTFSDPPTAGEVQAFVDWANNLRASLYRSP